MVYFQAKNTPNTRYEMSPKLNNQRMSNSLQQELCENARAFLVCYRRAPSMEWLTASGILFSVQAL